MDASEWKAYVNKIVTCDYPIPSNMISNYEDWHCRSIVGRMLLILKDIEGAMTVLATTRDVVPDMEDNPEYGLSDCEHKVLCLRDIAEIVWQLTGTADAPLVYLRQADKLCREYKYIFRSADRGRIWVRRLELKKACGAETEAIQEAQQLLQERAEKTGIDPYAFHAWKFLAECEADQGNFAKAVMLLQKAYAYFPVNEAAERDIKEALEATDSKEQYARLHHCTTIQYRPWEDFTVPTIDDVRRLQMKNYLARLAAEQKKQEQ